MGIAQVPNAAQKRGPVAARLETQVPTAVLRALLATARGTTSSGLCFHRLQSGDNAIFKAEGLSAVMEAGADYRP